MVNQTPPAKNSRLGLIGIAVALLLIISLLLAAIFCAFPWKTPPAF